MRDLKQILISFNFLRVPCVLIFCNETKMTKIFYQQKNPAKNILNFSSYTLPGV